MAVGSGVTVIIAGQDDTSKVLDQIEERMRRAAKPAAELGQKLGDGMGHAVPQVAAASAAIRLFEGQIPIRAVERLITMVPGLGAALQVAFPVVGGIVFGEMIVENIKKFHDFYVEAQQANTQIAKSFSDATSAMRVQNDEASISNDRLQQQIDKLERHPNNGLKLALDEAKLSADQLYVSLTKANDTFKEILEKKSIGVLNSFITGNAKTKVTSGPAREAFDNLQGVLDRHQPDIDAAYQTGDSAKIQEAIHRRNQDIVDTAHREVAKLKPALAELQDAQDKFLHPRMVAIRNARGGTTLDRGGNQDQSANLSIVQGAMNQLLGLAIQAQQHDLATDLKPRLAKDEAKKIDDERAAKAEELRQKINNERAAKAEELRQKMQTAKADFNASMAKLQQAGAEESLRLAKAEQDEDLARLGALHKLKLISEEEFQQQKLAIEERFNGAQIGAANLRRAAVNTQIAGLEGQTFNGPDAAAKRLERDAKVNDLMAERQKIAGQIATIEGDSAKKRIEAEAQILESHRRDAEENYSRASTVLDAGRNNVAFRQRRGLISGADARTQNNALDAQRADELQKVVDAYQQIADTSEGGTAADANAKIAQLREQIIELRNPIDETAESLRSGFDSAFEGLFENIDQGGRAFENFAKSIQRSISQQVYKELIQPQIDGLLRQASGSISGVLKPGGTVAPGVDLSSVVRPFTPGKVGGAPGVLDDVLGQKGKVGITIVLQQDAAGNASIADVLKSGNGSDQFEVNAANSFSTGGFLYQLLKGGGGGN